LVFSLMTSVSLPDADEAEIASAGVPSPAAPRQPAYQAVKEHVLAQIRSGVWKEGDAIPAEEALARQFGLSRMTVNRAMRELGDEKIVTRVQGSGTFVAQQKYQATLVAIRNIAEEVAARGHVHRSELQRLERCTANEALARQFEVPARQPLFHSVVVHLENELPIQVEDRHVLPELAPDYLTLDFRSQTPNAYLMRVAPPQKVSFEIEAVKPTREVAELLHMGPDEYCLVLHRRTFSRDRVASVASMWHPASRYRFTGSF
jgi:GntR family histidine utilization transcriptional repressor